MFNDIVRFNMDLIGEYEDVDIVNVLECVGFWVLIVLKFDVLNKFDEWMDDIFFFYG